jgi:hypothetical protein
VDKVHAVVGDWVESFAVRVQCGFEDALLSRSRFCDAKDDAGSFMAEFELDAGSKFGD